MAVERIKGRKVCFPAVCLASIFDAPLLMATIDAGIGKVLHPPIGPVTARHLPAFLIPSLHAASKPHGF
ncbi:MAG: hypothetical protein HY282_08065 [Nitrospirae bacterium]|nr:hypothetical protein [Candidatus Manganitrophaceae bacterium]